MRRAGEEQPVDGENANIRHQPVDKKTVEKTPAQEDRRTHLATDCRLPETGGSRLQTGSRKPAAVACKPAPGNRRQSLANRLPETSRRPAGTGNHDRPPATTNPRTAPGDRQPAGHDHQPADRACQPYPNPAPATRDQPQSALPTSEPVSTTSTTDSSATPTPDAPHHRPGKRQRPGTPRIAIISAGRNSPGTGEISQGKTGTPQTTEITPVSPDNYPRRGGPGWFPEQVTTLPCCPNPPEIRPGGPERLGNVSRI